MLPKSLIHIQFRLSQLEKKKKKGKTKKQKKKKPTKFLKQVGNQTNLLCGLGDKKGKIIFSWAMKSQIQNY